MKQKTWTISELANEFSITPRTIRFYEDQGIVSPTRDGLTRIYHARDRTRLKLALRGKRLGLPLSEILSLINMYDGPGGTVAQLHHYMEVLNQPRHTLEQPGRDLEQSLSGIDEQRERCETLPDQRLPDEAAEAADSASGLAGEHSIAPATRCVRTLGYSPKGLPSSFTF